VPEERKSDLVCCISRNNVAYVFVFFQRKWS